MKILKQTATICLATACFFMVTANPSLGDEAPAYADSNAVEEMVVSGVRRSALEGNETEVPSAQVKMRNPASMADLGGILPSVRVSTNSRGESTLMIRGAPERHVQTFLDGIPLNLPWDERVDLESIPITGLARLEGRRGLPSLLDGPGALAGSVRILHPGLRGRQSARLGLSLGTGGEVRANLTGQRKYGSWNTLAAGSWHNRDHFPVPGTGDARFNSDVGQLSLLARASREVAGHGRLNLLFTAWGGDKGVPPENHLGDDARFWRYPLRSRALFGSSLYLPLGDHLWDLNAMVAADFFRQEIDPRGPDGWDQPLVNGQDYEKDFDRTGHLSLGLTRWVSSRGSLTLQTHLRYTQHRESLTVGGGVNSYSQLLGDAVLEGEFFGPGNLKVRLGAGLDGASTPESGDKVQAESFTAPAFSLHATKPIGLWNDVYASASRRSRFPSLRELYSGALGRFVPNGDLVPEEQDLVEVGFSRKSANWDLSAGAFLQYLNNGIEKMALPGPDRQFMRVNRTKIRVPGLEFQGNVQLGGPWQLSGQHTILAARIETESGYDQPAEDRPDYLTRLGINKTALRGPGTLIEAEITGARWSADATNAETGLTRLPASIKWNARLSWRWVFEKAGHTRNVETFVRVDNLFDQYSEYQIGLPVPGRVFSVGGSVGY